MHFVYDQMGSSDSTNKLWANASFLRKRRIELFQISGQVVSLRCLYMRWHSLTWGPGGMTYIYMIYQLMCFFECISSHHRTEVSDTI